MRQTQHVLVLAIAATLGSISGCASAPPPAPPPISYEQKMAWILQLEDQRLLALPDPPAAVPAQPRRARDVPPPPSSEPKLARLLTDTDARIRRRAAIAVGRVGLTEGVPMLTPVLADADPEVRMAAAFGLGLIGDRSAGQVLLPLLQDADPRLRGRAAEALGLVGARDAAADIGRMVAEYARTAPVAGMQPDEERPGPPEAEAFKLGLFALVRLQSYEQIAAAVLDQGGKPISTWWPIAYALQRVEDPRAAPALRQLLQVKGRYTPAFAARGLGSAKDPKMAEPLLPLLDYRQPREVVAAAIRAVEQLRAAAAAPRLGALAADPKVEPNLRLLSVTALGTIEAFDQLAVVQNLLTDEWPVMRAAAIRAAAAIDEESFLLLLSGMDRDRQWSVRAALADVMATLPVEIATERLMGMLSDEDRRVIPSVLRSLSRVRAPALSEVLVKHLQEPDFVIRETAARLVGETKMEGGVALLREAYKTALPDSAYGARAAAIDAMAAFGGPEAAEGVKAALADKDWAVRVRAVELLSKLEPGVDYRQQIRPVPSPPTVSYADPQLVAVPFSPHVFIDTAKGTIEFELAVLDAPQTTRNFMVLARKGFFNGLPIHRVVPNFVVQDGDSRGDGEGGPGYTIRDELNDRPYVRGTVGMALAWRDTGGSQFFVTHSPQPHLDARYTAFGHVVNGMDVVDRIQQGDVIQRVRVWDGSSW
jgi:cyclophilin family peptidyl-prolyl cis-trans isomerase/HEAT repeat protein